MNASNSSRRDAERVEVVVRVRRAVQPLHAAELVGALLDLLRRQLDAVPPRRVRGQLVAHELLHQPLELAGQLEYPHEFVDADHFLVDPHDGCHRPLLFLAGICSARHLPERV